MARRERVAGSYGKQAQPCPELHRTHLRGEEMTRAEVAEALGLSEEGVRRCEYRALRKVRALWQVLCSGRPEAER